MDKLLEQQSCNQIELEKFINNLNKTPKARRTEGYFEKRRELLDALWKDCREVNRQMLEIYEAKDHANLPYFKTDIYSELEESYCNAHGIIFDMLKPYRTLPQVQTVTKSEPNNDIRLPRINIPVFAGSYQSWTPFRDLFTSMIHNNKQLSNVQKFHYLQSSVTGEAKQLIRHLQLTDANYLPAWELLEHRYQNERMLVNTQLQILMSIPSHNIESTNNLKKMVDISNECLEGLKSLNVKIDNWDPLLIFLLTQKLSRDTITHWESTLGKRDNPNALPTWKEFKEFLESRFKTLDAINRTKVMYPHRETNSKGTGNELSPHAFVTNMSSKCPACRRDHRLKQCHEFLGMSPKIRYEFIRKLGRCINCFSKAHSVKECSFKMNCQKCGKHHNTLLHFDNAKPYSANTVASNSGATINKNSVVPKANGTHQVRPANQYNAHYSQEPQYPVPAEGRATSDGDKLEPVCIQNHFSKNEHPTVLLATALVNVVTPNAGTQTIRILLDQGSQASFITEDAVQRLRLQKKATYALISGIGNTESGTSKGTIQCLIQSCIEPNYKRQVEAFVLPKITGIIPTQKIDTPLQHLQGVQLADPLYMKPGRIDMLLGAEIYAEILCDGLIKGPIGSPIAQNTMLGWIVSGKASLQNINRTENVTPQLSFVCSISDTNTLEQILKRFWEIEEVPQPNYTKPDDALCEEIYSKSVYRNSNGRYTVTLPFKNNSPPDLGDSRQAALKRLLQLERKLSRDHHLYADYRQFMREYISLGHMQKITPDHETVNNDNNEYFLPHHAVIKESSTTTKVRVVFDASSKTTNQKSLNDTLLAGPTLQQDLTAIILRWRVYKVAFSADIEKMYRQIWVHPKDCQYQKIFWRENPTLPIEEYKLLTVTYGTSCAPYLAIRTLIQLAEDEKLNFPLASSILLNDFYVDDLISGAHSIDAAIQIQEQLRTLLDKGGFRLRKWVCNSEKVLTHIPADDREISASFPIESSETVKTLGVHWNPVCDTFEFKITLNENSDTVSKRTILSESARLYDPLGWISPSTIVAKILLQKLWLAGVDWDNKLPSNLEKQWREFRNDLRHLEKITIPRWIKASPSTVIELHAFCDASMHAFATVVYARCEMTDGTISSTLLAAKTKVAPIRQISIPRLELCGAVLLAKLVSHIKASINIENLNVYGWTDSLNVLAWIRGHPRQWHTFVANRVSQIQEQLSCENWRYVKSADNPADCASRGISPKELVTHPLWWMGPSWLTKPKHTWPCNISQDIHTDLEAKRITLIHHRAKEVDLSLVNRFSHFNRLIHVTAYCLRFIDNRFKSREQWVIGNLTIKEIGEAKVCIEKLVQRAAFGDEIRALESKQTISTRSRLTNLNPFLDSDGLLRVGGRLKHANITYNQKYPVILPEKSNFTRLVIQDCHIRSLHGGTQLTLNLSRKRYWIINGKNCIRHQIHKCLACFKYKAKAQEQLMGSLPQPRVDQNRPFLHTGVDFTGYLLIRESKCRGRPKTSKGYISVFICLSTRAIHLELVSELSTDAFLAAFKRFVSRRGLCSNLYSDCGTNFIGADKRLQQDKLKSDYGVTKDLIPALTNSGTQWHFIPPASPHFGGLWEAGVKSVKHHLKRIIGDSLLTFEEITTVLTQIEACLNSRPLCPLTNDPDDCTALTPGHFLIGDALLTPPEPNILDTKINTISRWQMLQRMVQDFWKRWLSEYLPRLQNRTKWTQQTPNIELGDLVLVKDERLPPCQWLLGRVHELHPGKDGLVRVVTLRCKDSFIKRPVAKICLLPIKYSHDKQ